MGLPPNSSARMQPTDQTSIAVVLSRVSANRSFDWVTYIVGEAQHDFWCSVPSGGNVLCHESLISGSFGGTTPGCIASSKAKVTNLELTVCIDEQVAWFQIPVKDIGRMDVFQTTEGLIEKRLEVSISQRLTRSDLGSKLRT